MKVAALQETLWFGSSMYCVGESVVLTAGRPVPGAGEPMRGEGVAIILYTVGTSSSSMELENSS